MLKHFEWTVFKLIDRKIKKLEICIWRKKKYFVKLGSWRKRSVLRCAMDLDILGGIFGDGSKLSMLIFI